jgi:predicted enzyme related to lactoylglutathione lyase
VVIKSIVHFEIPANDAASLSRFYADTFGWKFEKQDMGGMEYWLITTGPRSKSVGGGMDKKMGPTDAPRNFVNVDDIDSTILTFNANGGKEVMGKQEVPGMGWTYIGVDPEGNMVGLWEAMKKRARPAAKKSDRRAARKSR